MSVLDTKQFDGETPVILELWRMRSNPSLPSLTDPFWPGVVAPDRFLPVGQIELFDIKTVSDGIHWLHLWAFIVEQLNVIRRETNFKHFCCHISDYFEMIIYLWLQVFVLSTKFSLA